MEIKLYLQDAYSIRVLHILKIKEPPPLYTRKYTMCVEVMELWVATLFQISVKH